MKKAKKKALILGGICLVVLVGAIIADVVLSKSYFKEIFDWWSVGIVVGEIARWVGDCYILTNKRACKWDSCAPQVILQEAWGKITDVFWNNINYLDWTEKLPNLLVATNGKIHEKIIEKTKEIFS